jgi:hypothetical protein
MTKKNITARFRESVGISQESKKRLRENILMSGERPGEARKGPLPKIAQQRARSSRNRAGSALFFRQKRSNTTKEMPHTGKSHSENRLVFYAASDFREKR